MALNINNPYGTIKGSIGGNTFQGGAFGQVVKRRSNPINANTPGQALSRNALRGFATSWKTLSGADRALWSAFALNGYHPKPGRPSTGYSGYMAYMSCRSFLMAMNRTMVPVSRATPASPTYAAVTQVPINVINAIPSVSMGNDILPHAPSTGTIQSFTRTMTVPSFLEIRNQFNYFPPNTYLIQELQNSVGIILQACVYFSDVIPYPGAYISNKFKWLVGNTGVFDCPTRTLAGQAGFDLAFDITDSFVNFRSKPRNGDYVNVYFVLFDALGTCFFQDLGPLLLLL